MKRFQRILAMTGVVLIVFLVFLTLYFAVTGSPYFMASVGAMFGVPILLYTYFFIYRIFGNGREDSEDDPKE